MSISLEKQAKENKMSKYYGVKCGKCRTPVIIDTLGDFEPNKLEFGVVPLTPITCQVPNCGYSVQYGSRDGFEFEIREDTK